jgi:Raf kinase inhibitor-like YbhB/YbcL family protein
MRLTSSFSEGEEIPKQHTKDDRNTSPPLAWTDAPPGTKSFAIIVSDPDAPDPAAPKRTWVHWVVTDLPPEVAGLDEGTTGGGVVGHNDWKETAWGGPQPPIGRHRYFFKLYALDTVLGLAAPTKAEALAAMEGHVLAEAELMGTFPAP